MENLTVKQKIFLGILGGIVIIILIMYVFNKENSTNYIEHDKIDNLQLSDEIKNETTNIIVHIAGEVEKEGVIELRANARLYEAIDAAGGITNAADLSQINLANILKDGQKVYIPSIEDIKQGYIQENIGQNIFKEVGKIDINTATQTELETLSGIGASTALKIINYRNENGKFSDIEEIKNVPGIGDSKYESIKDSITVN